MKKTISISVLLLILIGYGCIKNQKDDQFTFSKIKTLNWKKIDLGSNLRTPAEIQITNEKIIIYEIQSDWFFFVFCRNNFSLLGRIARKGRGPDEEVFVNPFFRAFDEDFFSYQNHNAIKYGKFEIVDGGLVIFPEIEFELPVELRGDFDFFKVDTLLLLSSTTRPVSRDFQVFCTKTNKIFEIGEPIPSQAKEKGEEWTGSLSGKLTSMKPDNKKLASVFNKFPIVRIYDATSITLLKEIQVFSGLSQVENENQHKQKPNAEIGSLSYYWRVRSTDEYIFGLFSGSIPPKTEIEGGVPRYLDVASIIHVFDWDGNPIMKLELDRPIFSFDVTTDNKQIIAISITDPDHLLVAEIPWD